MSGAGQWENILLLLAPLFTAPSREIFCRLASAWVICPGRRTVTGLFRLAEPAGSRSHDAYHRFFREGAWSLAGLWKILARLLVGRFYPEGPIPLDLDDTLFHKTGRRMEGTAWWRDAVASTGGKVAHAFGLNLLVLSLRVYPPWGGEPLALPVNMRLHRKRGVPLLDLAREVISEVCLWFPNRKFDLCADGFYAPLAGSLPQDVSLTSRLRKDAALFNLKPERKKGQRGRPRTKGERLETPEEMSRGLTEEQWRLVTTCERGRQRERLIFSRQALWYKVRKGAPILFVISRDPEGKERDDFFFSTEVGKSPEEVVCRYAGRWAIEDTFRNAKQYLGGQDPQSWRGQGPERAAALSFILYSLIWLWYIKAQGKKKTWAAVPWYPKKARPSFLDALACLRRVLWQQRLFSTSGNLSLSPKMVKGLIDILSRAA